MIGCIGKDSFEDSGFTLLDSFFYGHGVVDLVRKFQAAKVVKISFFLKLTFQACQQLNDCI